MSPEDEKCAAGLFVKWLFEEVARYAAEVSRDPFKYDKAETVAELRRAANRIEAAQKVASKK